MKAELRKEYAEIVETVAGCFVEGSSYSILAKQIALACQELADRPPRELTDAEILSIYTETVGDLVINPTGMRFAKAIIAAHIAKQREPQVVRFRAARNPDGTIDAFKVDADGAPENEYFHSAGWEWLDADGKAQEFEVRI